MFVEKASEQEPKGVKCSGRNGYTTRGAGVQASECKQGGGQQVGKKKNKEGERTRTTTSIPPGKNRPVSKKVTGLGAN